MLQGGLDRLDLVVSETPLGKHDAGVAALSARVRLLEAVAETRPWMNVRVDEGGLIADIAVGYDAVVLGADKWQQVADPAWYGGAEAARDEAVGRLPRVLLAPREGFTPSGLPEGSVVLRVPAEHGVVSASGAREGRVEWVASEVVLLWEPPVP